MNDRERFLAVARGEKPDYVPIFGFPGAPGMSRGCMRPTHARLVAGGMPAHIGGCYENGVCRDVESWFRYWGSTGPVTLDFEVAWGAEGIRTTRRVEDGYVIIEGYDGLIEPELRHKVPPLLAQGRYFPNGDHGIQPLATFNGLCRFMTLLHEMCGNPEGQFPASKGQS